MLGKIIRVSKKATAAMHGDDDQNRYDDGRIDLHLYL